MTRKGESNVISKEEVGGERGRGGGRLERRERNSKGINEDIEKKGGKGVTLEKPTAKRDRGTRRTIHNHHRRTVCEKGQENRLKSKGDATVLKSLVKEIEGDR